MQRGNTGHCTDTVVSSVSPAASSLNWELGVVYGEK